MSKHRMQSVIILFFFILLALGCNNEVRHHNESNLSPGIILPKALDFGRVRVDESPVILPFEITNASSSQIVIKDVTTGCGCTVVDIPERAILANETVQSHVRIDIRGRLGKFSNMAFITTSDGDVHRIDIYGTVISDIWASSSSVNCVAYPGDEIVSTTYEIYTEEYPELDFDLTQVGDTVDAHVIARGVRSSGETFIRLGIDVHLGTADYLSTTLNLVPTDKDISPWKVAVHCTRSETKISPDLYTKQISLGAIKANEPIIFSVFGSNEIIDSITSLETSCVSHELSSKILSRNIKSVQSKPSELKIEMNIVSGSQGVINGKLLLNLDDGKQYIIPIFAEVN